jgi:hypothetical protein
MSIPVGFVAPHLPIAVDQYDRSSEDRFINALRLYFGLLDNQNQTLNTQVSTNQTLIWLSNG